MLRLARNHSSTQQTTEKKDREDMGRQSTRNLQIPNHVSSEPDGGIYHVGVRGRIEDPRDAADVYLVIVPVNGSILEDPGG